MVTANTVTASLATGDFTAGGSTLLTNYVSPATASGAGHISAVTLSASIIGNPSRPYNGNTTATLTGANFSLDWSGRRRGDQRHADGGNVNSKDVVTAATVTASLAAGDFTAGGSTLLTNYVLPTTASGAGHITAVTVSASIIGNPSRPYNGNTNAVLTGANFSLTGLVTGETISVTQTAGSYNSKDVVTANMVTATLMVGDFTADGGTLVSNYNLPTTASGAGHITAVTLTAVIIGDPTRPYNGNTNATLTGANFSLTGLVMGEAIGITQAVGSYNSKDVVTANTVTANLATGDFTAAAGTLTSNYNLPTSATGVAHITAVTLSASIIGNPSRPYNGNTNATLTGANFSPTGLVTGEAISVAQTGGTYNSKDVATAATVTANLVSGDFAAGGGTLVTNYVLPTNASGAGHITALTLTASIIGDPARPYNGNTNADVDRSELLADWSGRRRGDQRHADGGNVQQQGRGHGQHGDCESRRPCDFTAGGNTLLTNYVLPATASGAGHISAVTLTAVIIGNPTRPYNGNTNAVLTGANFSLTGVVSGETISVTQTAGTYNSKDVAAANTVTASLTPGDFTAAMGSLVSNYSLPISASGPGHIERADATIVVTPYSVPYDGGAHTATSTAKGVQDENLSGVDLSGTTHTNAGDYPSDPWTFTDAPATTTTPAARSHDNIARPTPPSRSRLTASPTTARRTPPPARPRACWREL